MDLLELAARCEAATGADRELDALIRCAVFANPDAYVKQSPINGAWCIYETGHNGKERSWEPRGLSQEARIGSFTASLDAAMLLIPKGWDFSLNRYAQIDTEFKLFSVNMTPEEQPYDVDREIDTESDILPLAICAAALRARAAQAGEG